MLPTEWTKMVIASAVAVIAMAYLAVDAGVDVNPGAIAKRIEVVQASIVNVAVSQTQRAFGVQAWARRGRDDQQKPRVEECLAID